MKKIKNIKIKQVHVPRLGAFVDSLYTTLPVMGAVNFVGIMAVLYGTVRPFLLYWFPWIKFWMFMGAMCAFVAVMMFLMYLFVLPSIWTFRQKQMFGFESEVVDRLDSIDKRLDGVDKKLGVTK